MTSPVTPYSVSKGSCSKYCKVLNLIPVLTNINTASATIPNNIMHATAMAKPSLKVETRNKEIGLNIHKVVAFASIGAAFLFSFIYAFASSIVTRCNSQSVSHDVSIFSFSISSFNK